MGETVAAAGADGAPALAVCLQADAVVAFAVLETSARGRFSDNLFALLPSERRCVTFVTWDAQPPAPADFVRALQLRGGVVISEVSADSPAAAAELRPGDIIVRLGYSQLLTIDDYDRAVAQAPQQTPIYMVFYRQGRAIPRTIIID